MHGPVLAGILGREITRRFCGPALVGDLRQGSGGAVVERGATPE